MELLLLSIYGSICWVVFEVFEVFEIPLNTNGFRCAVSLMNSDETALLR